MRVPFLRHGAPAALAALAALVALVAGCGGSSGGSSSSSSSGGGGSAATPSTSAAAPASAGPAAVITTKKSKLGTILAYGPEKLTVYLWEADKGSTSTCAGACATAWPPVTGTPKASGGALPGDLGTTKRADGSTQVTYKGHPLYRYAADKDAGDAYGEGNQGFGASWYVLKPSGAKVDES